MTNSKSYKSVSMDLLDEEELAFLKRKKSNDDRIYKMVYGLLLLLVLVISFFIGWYDVENAAGEKEWFFSWQRLFTSLAILFLLANVLALVVYKVQTRKLNKDIALK